MKIIRRFNIGGSWKQDYLSDEDILAVREKLSSDNKEVMIQCIKIAKEIMGLEDLTKNESTIGCLTGIALGLFDKLADPAFTRYQAELDERELKARDPFDSSRITAKKKKEDPETKELREEKIAADTSKDEVPIKDQIDDGL